VCVCFAAEKYSPTGNRIARGNFITAADDGPGRISDHDGGTAAAAAGMEDACCDADSGYQ
jgi:hypothetical protein